MKRAPVERGTELLFAAGASFQDFQLARFIAQRLAGVTRVALNFGGGQLLSNDFVVHHVLDGFLIAAAHKFLAFSNLRFGYRRVSSRCRTGMLRAG